MLIATVKARTDVHMIVNLICHLGSIAYELQMKYESMHVERQQYSLVHLQVWRNDRDIPLVEVGRHFCERDAIDCRTFCLCPHQSLCWEKHVNESFHGCERWRSKSNDAPLVNSEYFQRMMTGSKSTNSSGQRSSEMPHIMRPINGALLLLPKLPLGIYHLTPFPMFTTSFNEHGFADRVVSLTGILYFTAWSLSFYPQIILNFKRKR